MFTLFSYKEVLEQGKNFEYSRPLGISPLSERYVYAEGACFGANLALSKIKSAWHGVDEIPEDKDSKMVIVYYNKETKEVKLITTSFKKMWGSDNECWEWHWDTMAQMSNGNGIFKWAYLNQLIVQDILPDEING